MTGKKERKAYLHDFRLQDDGGYRYEGALYRTGLEPEQYRPAGRRFILFSLLPIALGIAAGCFPPDVFLPRVWILLPYTAAMISSLLTALSGIRFLEAGKDGTLRVYQYETTLGRNGTETRILTVSCAVTAAAGILTFLAHGSRSRAAEIILWTLCVVFMGICSEASRKYAESLSFRFEEPSF